MSAPPSSSPRIPWLAALAAVTVLLGFAAYTGHMWEDYLITFRSSLNLATGHGLVYQWGEPGYIFTSPLGTLLPALFARIGGENVAVNVLWWFRVASACALGGAVWTIARALVESRIAPLAVATAVGAIVLDPKIVDFSINGMESAWVVFFVVVTWRALSTGGKLLPCALGFAGLQWTRPDGCVYFLALALAWLVVGAPPGTPVPKRGWVLVRAGLLGAVLYLPWLLWAWRNCGSIVPHSLVAKDTPHAPWELLLTLATYPWRLLFGQVALHHVFMPAYFFLGGWPDWLLWISRFIAVVAALAWLVPGMRPAGRIASAAFLLGGFYVEIIPAYPWYYPGWQVLGLVAWGYLLDVVLQAAAPASRRPAWLPGVGRIAAMLLLVVQVSLLAGVAWEMRQQQAIIENGHRREIGLWLRGAAHPGDRVYLEPLGYVGYYSGLKMLDCIGLCSPEVVAARRAGHWTHASLIASLRPEWLVLRPREIKAILEEQPALLDDHYRAARIFSARDQVNSLAILPGRGYLDFDATFVVFHRLPSAPSP